VRSDATASSGAVVTSRAEVEQHADSTAELARLYVSWRGQGSAIEGLKGELRVTRRRAATLEGENSALRAELAAFRRGAWDDPPRTAAGPVAALSVAPRDRAAANGDSGGQFAWAPDGRHRAERG